MVHKATHPRRRRCFNVVQMLLNPASLPSSHLCTPLQSLLFLVADMHVRTLEGMKEEKRVSRSVAWKDSGRQRRGRERKNRRPLTPSEHLKLLTGLSSAASHMSSPSLPIPQACQDSVNGKNVYLFPPLFLSFLTSSTALFFGLPLILPYTSPLLF